MTFTGEPERSPGTTRVIHAVEIDIDVPSTEAIRVLFRALSIFSDWSEKPKGK